MRITLGIIDPSSPWNDPAAVTPWNFDQMPAEYKSQAKFDAIRAIWLANPDWAQYADRIPVPPVTMAPVPPVGILQGSTGTIGTPPVLTAPVDPHPSAGTTEWIPGISNAMVAAGAAFLVVLLAIRR